MMKCEWCEKEIDPDWEYGYYIKPDKDGKGGYCSTSCWMEHHGHSKDEYQDQQQESEE